MTFSPTAPVSYLIPIVISTPNIVGGVDNSLQFSSTGIQTGITVSPDAFTFGSVLLGETDSTKVLTIKNENPVTISITDITFDDPQFSVSGSTSFSLSAGDLKTLKVKFTPDTLGVTMGILTVHNTSVLDSTSKVSLSGIGVEAGISLSKTEIDFGNTPAGTFRDDSISVTNNGSGVLKIDTIISSNSNFLVLGNAGKRQVEPNANFWLKIRFYPGNSTEALSENISIVSNAQQSPHLITVTGTGTRSSLSAALSIINFGKRSLTSTSDTTISISNNGNATVTITDTNTTSAAFSIVTFPETIAAGENEDITIRFKSPVADGGDFHGAAVSLAYTDGSENGSISVTVSGTAAAKPYCDTIKISPATVTWDTIGQVVFQASADDSDDAGTGARIAKYLWSSSIDGKLSSSTSSFTLQPSDLSIGTHSITCRVIDNEGDTSSTVTNSITVTDRPPCAMISSITPDGLIIKGSGDVIFSGRGWDQDQFAKNSYDSLKSFQWYSTAQGLLGAGKTLTISSSTLQLGNHGFYIKVVDNENSTAYSDTLLVPVQAGIGRALIVAGTAFDDHTYFTKNIAPNCNWAYTKLLDRGFTHEQIYYMNPIGWQSLKEPYTNSKIVDTTSVTLDVLRSFLLKKAVKNDVQNSVPLVLYLLGHGSSALNNGRFYLNKTEYLTPDTLSAWLNSYGDLPSTSQIIVILDFCYSGSYQSKLRTSFTQNRIIISSSDASTAAYFSNGKCFGWNIWNNVYQGKNLATAFTNALNWSNANAPGENKANPLLNCDNNGTNNAANDYEIAGTVFIGGSQQLQALTSEIDSVTAAASEEGITISAHLHGTFSAVWSRLYAPGFDPSAQQNAPSVELTKVNDTLWCGVYTGSRILGTYLIVTEGSDGDEKYVMGLPCEVVNDIAVDTENHPSISRLPSVVFLGTAYPNPVAGKALISYGLPKAMKVQISLYDLRGRLVATLVDANKIAGYHQALWDLQSNSRQVGSGNYICRLVAGRKVITRHLMVGK